MMHIVENKAPQPGMSYSSVVQSKTQTKDASKSLSEICPFSTHFLKVLTRPVEEPVFWLTTELLIQTIPSIHLYKRLQ